MKGERCSKMNDGYLNSLSFILIESGSVIPMTRTRLSYASLTRVSHYLILKLCLRAIFDEIIDLVAPKSNAFLFIFIPLTVLCTLISYVDAAY